LRNFVCSGDEEVRGELPDGVVVGVVGSDSDIVLEGRSDGGHIETEQGGPFLTSDTSGLGAVAEVIGGSTSAVVVHGVGLDTHEHAREVDLLEVGHSDVPDTVDVEFLSAVLANWIGVTVGTAINHGPVFHTANLGDNNIVLVIRKSGNLGLDKGGLVGGSNGSKGGCEGVLKHIYNKN